MAPPNRHLEHEQRLDRIESKIDHLAETVVSLARAEEKLISLENGNKALMEKMIRIQDKVEKNEKKTEENTVTISVINRIFWIIVSGAILTAIGAYLLPNKSKDQDSQYPASHSQYYPAPAATIPNSNQQQQSRPTNSSPTK